MNKKKLRINMNCILLWVWLLIRNWSRIRIRNSVDESGYRYVTNDGSGTPVKWRFQSKTYLICKHFVYLICCYKSHFGYLVILCIPNPSKHAYFAQRFLSAESNWMIYRGPGFLTVGHMIWLLSHTPSPVSNLSLFNQSSCVSLVELTDGRGRRGWGKSQIIRQRESLVLYKSFNTLCLSALNDTRCKVHS